MDAPDERGMRETIDEGVDPVTLLPADVRGLRALLLIANDRSCPASTRDLARHGLAGYLSSLLNVPTEIDDSGACS
jgi:hypothetical protein